MAFLCLGGILLGGGPVFLEESCTCENAAGNLVGGSGPVGTLLIGILCLEEGGSVFAVGIDLVEYLVHCYQGQVIGALLQTQHDALALAVVAVRPAGGEELEQTGIGVGTECEGLGLDLVALAGDGLFGIVDLIEHGVGLADEGVVETPCLGVAVPVVVGHEFHAHYLSALEYGEVVLVGVRAVAVTEVGHEVSFAAGAAGIAALVDTAG